VTREALVQKLETLRVEKGRSEQIFRQVEANIHAIGGAIQFAEELLAGMGPAPVAPEGKPAEPPVEPVPDPAPQAQEG
jgi:hypothetical protein